MADPLSSRTTDPDRPDLIRVGASMGGFNGQPSAYLTYRCRHCYDTITAPVGSAPHHTCPRRPLTPPPRPPHAPDAHPATPDAACVLASLEACLAAHGYHLVRPDGTSAG